MNAYEERIYDMQEAKEEGKTEGFEQGRSEGLELGRSEGEASGRAAEKLDMARAMKGDNEPVEKIARYTGLPKEKIQML